MGEILAVKCYVISIIAENYRKCENTESALKGPV